MALHLGGLTSKARSCPARATSPGFVFGLLEFNVSEQRLLGHPVSFEHWFHRPVAYPTHSVPTTHTVVSQCRDYPLIQVKLDIGTWDSII